MPVDARVSPWRAWGRRIADALVPKRCGGCGTPVRPGRAPEWCAACDARTEWVAAPWCAACGEEFLVGAAEDAGRFAGRTCRRCRERPPPYRAARAAARYAGPVRELVQALKFRGRRSLAVVAAGLILRRAGALEEALAGASGLLPVPLHPRRHRRRGYNQAELIARRLAAGLELPLLAGVLRRSVDTPPQVGLDRESRQANLQGAMTVPDPGRVAGLDLVLVDDVMTTGTTVAVCAGALLAAGASSVRVVALARD